MVDGIVANRVEWPGKENQAAQPKGYVYIIFESEKQVRELLNACTIQDGNDANSGNYYFKISSKRIKAKEVSWKRCPIDLWFWLKLMCYIGWGYPMDNSWFELCHSNLTKAWSK